MKKLSIILLAAAAMIGVTACQDEKGFVEPATNPQLPAMTAENLVVASEIPSAIDLTAYNNDNDRIVLGSVTKCDNLPAGYELQFVGTIAREADFVHTADLKIFVEGTTVYTTADDLEGAYVTALGKSAKPKTVYFRATAQAKNEDAVVIFGTPETYYIEGSSTVTPIDLGIVIEDAYGLLGTINGWSVATAVPFDHEGDNGYDNPIFTMLVTINAQQAADGWWWKVVPQSTIAAGNWVDAANASFGTAVNGSDALDGNLVPRTDTQDCGAGCIKTPGIYLMTIDMENQSYNFVPQNSFLYTPGNQNGWNHNNAQWLVGEIGGTQYKGFLNLDGEFKFTSNPDWNGTNYGFASDGVLSTDGSAGNINAAAGCYFATVDTEALKYTLTPITSCGLIGDFNGWGGQQALTTTDGKVYTGRLTVTEGQGWKVRFNDNWDINLGGDLKNLTVGGANIVVPAGSYEVTLDLTNAPYTITLK